MAQATIVYSGDIVTGDLDKIYAAAKPLVEKNYLLELRISSRGGDLLEAAKIAHFVRAMWISVELGEISFEQPQTPSPCYSSCALIFFAGVFKTYWQDSTEIDKFDVEPWLGLHRPYFRPDDFAGLTAEEARLEFKRLQSFFRERMEEYDVPKDMIDEAMRVSSLNIRFVSPNEFESRFSSTAPWVEEYLIARCGGVSDNEQEFMFENLDPIHILPAFDPSKETNEEAIARQIFNSIVDGAECRRKERLAHQRNTIGVRKDWD